MSSDLVVTRTPLRVSFAGGGTDLPEFYQHDTGAVLSTAIDKYVYVTVKQHGAVFDEPVRLNYSETEMVERIDDIKNDIARECLRVMSIDPPIYISTVADVPAGSGLGSSSAFCVGLLKALYAYRGEQVSSGQLAEEAAHVEIEVLKRPVGKQDHYAAAYGGMHLLRFHRDGRVSVEMQRVHGGTIQMMFAHLMMFWTGQKRDAATILAEQRRCTGDKMDSLRAMRDAAFELNTMIYKGFDPVKFGHVLHHTWELKRGLTSSISNERIDDWYRLAMDAGALGGKLCGAGGGGFLLFLVLPEQHSQVRAALTALQQVPLGYEALGSRVLCP